MPAVYMQPGELRSALRSRRANAGGDPSWADPVTATRQISEEMLLELLPASNDFTQVEVWRSGVLRCSPGPNNHCEHCDSAPRELTVELSLWRKDGGTVSWRLSVCGEARRDDRCGSEILTTLSMTMRSLTDDPAARHILIPHTGDYHLTEDELLDAAAQAIRSARKDANL